MKWDYEKIKEGSGRKKKVQKWMQRLSGVGRDGGIMKKSKA